MKNKNKITAIVTILMFLGSIGAVYSMGDVLWTKTYNSGGQDWARDVAVDSSNNVIVTGYCRGGGDIYTIKYDANGNELWAKDYDKDGGSDRAFGVAVDSSNNIIVVGHVGTYGYYTIKYDGANGNVLWEKDGNVGTDGYAFGVAVDSSNNVIVTGRTGGTNVDYYTIKYDGANGNVLWTKTYDGGGVDWAHGVAVDFSNNIIVTGYSTLDGKEAYYTIKYDGANGNELWNKTYNGGGHNVAYGVAVDSSNNIIVTGYSNLGGTQDYYTIKYDGANGNELWTKTYNGGGEDWALDVAVDSFNNIIVTGMSTLGGTMNYYTIKYDANGNELWAKTYDGGDDDEAWGVAVDSSNNIIVTGYSKLGEGTNGYDYCTIKYQGIPPSKSLPIAQIMKLLGLYPKE